MQVQLKVGSTCILEKVCRSALVGSVWSTINTLCSCWEKTSSKGGEIWISGTMRVRICGQQLMGVQGVVSSLLVMGGLLPGLSTGFHQRKLCRSQTALGLQAQGDAFDRSFLGAAVAETKSAAAPCAVHASSSLDEVWAAMPQLHVVDEELATWGILDAKLPE